MEATRKPIYWKSKVSYDPRHAPRRNYTFAKLKMVNVICENMIMCTIVMTVVTWTKTPLCMLCVFADILIVCTIVMTVVTWTKTPL